MAHSLSLFEWGGSATGVLITDRSHDGAVTTINSWAYETVPNDWWAERRPLPI
jgi:hypothetical protein